MRTKESLVFFAMTVIIIFFAQGRAEHILRTNYGYSMNSISTIQLTSGTVRLVFHYQFPRPVINNRNVSLVCGQYTLRSTERRRCLQFRPVVYKLFEMKRDLAALLVQRRTEITEIIHQLRAPSRRTRGLGSWIGSGLASTFGLATDADLSELQSLMMQVLDGTQKAIETWHQGQNLVTRVTQLTNERFANMDRLLNMTRESLLTEADRIEELRTQSQSIAMILATVIEEIHLGLRHVQECEALYLAIQQLADGHLSHHLVPVNLLKMSLYNMRNALRTNSPHTKLVYNTVHYYYTTARVGGVVHLHQGQETLFIIIQAPITFKIFQYPLSVWQVNYFPLRAPDKQNYETSLATGPKFILYHPHCPYYMTADDETELLDKETGDFRDFADIHDTNTILRTVTEPSCALALLGDSLDYIKEQCRYHMRFKALTPAVFRISPSKLLIHNVSSIAVTYKANDSTPDLNTVIIKLPEPETLYTIPCESIAQVLGQIFYGLERCNNFSSDTIFNVTYPINLPVLRHYFSNHSLLEDINSAIELNTSLGVKLPRLLVEQPEYDHIMAEEREYKFDFEQAINASLDQEGLYSSLSHIIWQKFMHVAQNVNDFNPFNVFQWLSVICTILSVINTFVIVILCFKYKAMRFLLLSSRAVRADLVYTQPTVATENEPFAAAELWGSIKNGISEIWSIEILLILILLLLIISIIVYFCKSKFRVPKHQTFLRLDLQAADFKFQRMVAELGYSYQNYRFDITNGRLELEFQPCLTVLHLDNVIRVTNKLTGHQETIRNRLWLYPWQKSIVKHILSSQYIGIMTIFDHTYSMVDSIFLIAAGRSETHLNPIYPLKSLADLSGSLPDTLPLPPLNIHGTY